MPRSAQETVELLREHYNSRGDLQTWQLRTLEKLKENLLANKDALIEAEWQDMGRSTAAATMMFGMALQGVDLGLQLCAPDGERHKPIDLSEGIPAPFGGCSSAQAEYRPLGVTLVVCPWNFSLRMNVCDVVHAIVAGNNVCLKLSEISEASTRVFVDKIWHNIDGVECFEGGVPETTELLRQKFDHIFYTGNTAVGKVYMRAAAEHLTPVTLELGGKNPVYLDAISKLGGEEEERSTKLLRAVRAILGAKAYVCMGQGCASPDYVLCLHEDLPLLKQAFQKIHAEFYGDANPTAISTFESSHEKTFSGRIINSNHLNRLCSYLEEDHGGEIVLGGLDTVVKAENHLGWTIVANPRSDSKLMTNELFGPVIVLKSFDSMEAAVSFQNSAEHLKTPLCQYIFTEDMEMRDMILVRMLFTPVTTNLGNYCLIQRERLHPANHPKHEPLRFASLLSPFSLQ